MARAPVEVSVVIPCLNEEPAVGAAVEAAWEGIASTGLPGEVVVVDNASTDRSAEVAEAHGARVVSEPRRGYGSAYLAGLDASRGRYLVMADADGTYPIAELGAFVRLLQEGNEMVLGSRFAGTIQKGAMPWSHRWIGNPVLTAILNAFFGVRVSDAHCGMRAVRKDVLPRLGLQTTGMEFASEMIVKAGRRNLRIAEVPITYRPRIGDSKLHTFRDGWRHLRFMLVHSPTWLFIVPGIALLLLGLVPLLALAAGPVSVFGRSWEIHTMIVAATLTLVAAQVIQLGLFARTYAVLYLNERDPTFERLWRVIRLEHGLALGALLLLAGVGLLAFVFATWASGGYGRLGYAHPALLGLTLAALGVQTVFGSFFLSVLGLRKHLVLDKRDGAATEGDMAAAGSSQ